MQKNEISLDELVTIIKTLRSDKGCPWDRKQTAVSLVKYIKEETTELLEAIDANDTDNLCEELGDVLYLIVMLAEIHSEQQIFTSKTQSNQFQTNLYAGIHMFSVMRLSKMNNNSKSCGKR